MDRTHRTAAAVLAALLLGLLAAPAAAHVTATPNEAHSPFFKVSLRIGHGCAGSPTTAVRVRIPDGVADARPEVTPGWDIELVREGADAAARPAAVPARHVAQDDEDEGEHGETPATGRVTEVAWVGGSLPDEHLQEFGLSGRFTDEAPDVVYFPVVQECTEGEHRWIDVPATLEEWGDLDEPAPYVRLAFRDGDAGPAGEGAPAAGGADDPAGDAAPGDAAAGEGALAAGEGGGADPLALAGLVAGLAGLAAGGLALARTRRA